MQDLPEKRTARLRSLMGVNSLNSIEIGEILDRSPQTIRSWSCANNDRIIPKPMLQLLEIKLVQLGYSITDRAPDELADKRARHFRALNVSRIQKRRALYTNSVPPWFGEFDELVVYEANDLVELRKQLTGLNWQVDHMVPHKAKNASGLHVGVNIQVIPAAMNRRKKNKLVLCVPFEWVREL